MKLCVDFDGTIVDHQFPEVGNPVPGAAHWLRELQQAGAKIILYTMRGAGQRYGDTLSPAVKYCESLGLRLYGVNIDPDQVHWTDSPKAYGTVYVDDAAFGCPLRVNPRMGGRPFVDWDLVGPALMARILEKK